MDNGDGKRGNPDVLCGDSTDETSQPIYEGSRLTLSVSIMLIMTFIMRHHMTGAAVSELIALIEAHMIDSAKLM